MGVQTKAITFVGREFKNEKEALAYLESRVSLTENDYDEMGLNRRLIYLLEAKAGTEWPTGGLYSIWNGDENCGFYLGYNIYDADPKKMQIHLDDAEKAWSNFFKDTPKVIQAVLYY